MKGTESQLFPADKILQSQPIARIIARTHTTRLLSKLKQSVEATPSFF